MDSDGLRKARAAYTGFPNALKPPFVTRGDTMSSGTFWHGTLLNQWANEWTRYFTGGKGNYMISAMEDSGTLQALTFLDQAGRADLKRVLVLRTVSNYDREPPGVTPAADLKDHTTGRAYAAVLSSLEAAEIVGDKVVRDIVQIGPSANRRFRTKSRTGFNLSGFVLGRQKSKADRLKPVLLNLKAKMRIDGLKRISFSGTRVVALALLLPCASNLCAQTGAKPATAASASLEQRAARAFDAARANPLDLRAFLVRMPKGTDLHYHLSGGIYAETFIRDGAEDGLCVDVATHAFVRPQAAAQSEPPQPACGEGKVPAAQAFSDQHLYDALIDAFSMRSFVPSAGVSGHDHFSMRLENSAGSSPRHTSEWLDEVATRAALQNEQYVELMVTPNFDHTASIAKELGGTTIWPTFVPNWWRGDCATIYPWPEPNTTRPRRNAAFASTAAKPQESPACKSRAIFVSGPARISERTGFRADAPRLRNCLGRSPSSSASIL